MDRPVGVILLRKQITEVQGLMERKLAAGAAMQISSAEAIKEIFGAWRESPGGGKRGGGRARRSEIAMSTTIENFWYFNVVFRGFPTNLLG